MSQPNANGHIIPYASITVMSSNLGSTGEALDINEGDIARIKKATRRRRLALRTFGWLMPILSFGSALFLSGAFKAEDVGQASTYPLAAAAIMASNKALTQKTRFMMFGTVVLSAVAFVFGFLIGSVESETTATTRYGALRKLDDDR